VWGGKRFLRVAGFGGVALGLAIFAACDFDKDKALAVAASLPRTAAAASWGMQAALLYRRVLSEYEVSCHQAGLLYR
jgi:hypothetical protein